MSQRALRTTERLLVAVAIIVSSVFATVALTSTTTAQTPTTSGFVSLTPFRVLDTRSGAKPSANTTLTVNTGQAGASAAAVNITLTDTEGFTFVAAWASGPWPGTSILNAGSAGATIANFAIVPVASNGTFQLLTSAPGHLIVDVMGYTTASGSTVPPTGGGFSAIVTGYGPGFSITTVVGSVTNNSGAEKDLRVDVRCPDGNVETDLVFNIQNGQTLGWQVICDGVFNSGASVSVIEI